MKGLTPDEKLLLALYRAALQTGDLFSELDLSSIAKTISLKETALKNIVKHLAQANFLRKQTEKTVCLTAHGCSMIEQFL